MKKAVDGKKVLSILGLLILAIFVITGCEEDSNDNENDKKELPEVSGYPVVGTNQTKFYDNTKELSGVSSGEALYGQNANYPGNTPKYQDNEDGTVTDMITGLTWSQTADLNGDGKINVDDKLSYDDALASVSEFTLAGYNDWRLPTIKELYSLIMFSGFDISGYSGTSTDGLIPFMNTQYFDCGFGDTDTGERLIDGQYASSTIYAGTTMGGAKTMFGVNFVDGRIKGYPAEAIGMGGEKTYYVMYVRGNTSYGVNKFVDNGDGTITDEATGLMWMQTDNGKGLNWKDALSYAEESGFAGYSDWRLPDAKELQSLVDYTRSPQTTGSAAINQIFNCTEITNEKGEKDYPFYWSSTTHANWSSQAPGANAAYVSFGQALGYMNGSWMDVHGAGAQRSDPKAGNASDYPTGHGPQGDAIRILNYVRLVRNVK